MSSMSSQPLLTCALCKAHFTNYQDAFVHDRMCKESLRTENLFLPLQFQSSSLLPGMFPIVPLPQPAPQPFANIAQNTFDTSIFANRKPSMPMKNDIAKKPTINNKKKVSRAPSKTVATKTLSEASVHLQESTFGKHENKTVLESLVQSPARKVSKDATQPKLTQQLCLEVKQPACGFVQGSRDGLWECSGCNSLPFHWRATGSVIFSTSEPTKELVETHSNLCMGKKPLQIPVEAQVTVKDGKNFTVEWNTKKRKTNRQKKKQKTSSIQDNTFVFEAIEGEDYVYENFDSSYLECKEIGIDISESSFLPPEARQLGTNYTLFILLQLLPKAYSVNDDEELNDVSTEGNDIKGDDFFHTLVCKHCENHDFGQESFPDNTESLQSLLPMFARHLSSCNKCPSDIKDKLNLLLSFHESQKVKLAFGAEKELFDIVWSSVLDFFGLLPLDESNDFDLDGIPNTPDYSLYVLKQYEPCQIEAGHSRAKSYEIGFKGIQCRHCASRQFFYRSGEIFSGNFSSFSNHLQQCKSVPEDVKESLVSKRLSHGEEMASLGRTAQKEFLKAVYNRLHSVDDESDDDESDNTDTDDDNDESD